VRMFVGDLFVGDMYTHTPVFVYTHIHIRTAMFVGDIFVGDMFVGGCVCMFVGDMYTHTAMRVYTHIHIRTPWGYGCACIHVCGTHVFWETYIQILPCEFIHIYISVLPGNMDVLVYLFVGDTYTHTAM